MNLHVNDAFDLRRSAALFGQNTALLADAGRAWSYLEVWASAESIATTLLQRGVSHATPWVAIEPRKDVASVLAIWTLMSLGIPFVVLHSAWSESQKSAVLDQTGAVFTPLPNLPLRPTEPQPVDVSAYARLERRVTFETPLCVVYTSGTTAEPKGVILSRRALLSSAEEARTWLRLTTSDRWFLSLSLAHVGGLSVLARCWLAHASVVVHPSSQATFVPDVFIAALEETRATLASLVPTQMQRLCANEQLAPTWLRLVLLGGASAPESLVAQARQRGFNVAQTYGLTELSSIVATAPVTSPATSNKAHSSHPLRLHEHVDAQLSADGRLMLRGQSLFSGYWGQREQMPSEWFTTEDLAELDGRNLRVLGRADDIIVTGGEKVHPTKVEDALLACPGIVQACVFARTSDEWGQEVCAALVVGEGFSSSDTLSCLRASLPSFNIPRAWVLVVELPTNPNGKLRRSTVARELGPLCRPFFDVSRL